MDEHMNRIQQLLEDLVDTRTAEAVAQMRAMGGLSDGTCRNQNYDGVNWSHLDLSNANLSGSSMRGALMILTNFQGANLKGCDFTGTNLQKANLKDANLEGCDFTDAELFGATLPDGSRYGEKSPPEDEE